MGCLPARRCACGTGKLDCRACHLFFTEGAVPRQLFDDVPIVIAAGEVHGRIHRSWVLPEDLLDMAQVLDEQPPVNGREQPQAADAVADGHLVDGLLLRIELHMALDAQCRLAEQLFDPGQWLSQRAAVAL
ncbi:hypothetical protein D3C81_681280 [compost metagenome]